MKALLVGILAFIGILKGCLSARFIDLGVPGFVLKGQQVWLNCSYDLEGDDLYSVKWYKDNVEFYRYLPSDIPSAQMYKLDGVYLDRQLSNASHVFLYTSEMETEGVYACEVSTLLFRTIKAEKELYVYVIPERDPTLFGVQNRYPIGSEVNVTCVFGPSKPVADLKWYINGDKAHSSYVRHKTPEIDQNDLITCESRLVFVVDPSHLRQGALSIQCIATVSLVYSKSSRELKITDGVSGTEFQHVPHVPPGLEGPSITGSASRYYVGNPVDVNCSSARSHEPAKLQWYLNDKEVKPEFQTNYTPTMYPDGLSSTKLGLQFKIQKDHFKGEEMRLKCTATLAKVHKMTTVETISVGPQRASGFQILDHSQSGWTHVTDTSMEYLICFSCLFLMFFS